MEEEDSPYRLGKVAMGFVVLVAVVSAAPGILAGSVGLGIGSFIGTLIAAFIGVSVLKFVFVAGKRTLLQEDSSSS